MRGDKKKILLIVGLGIIITSGFLLIPSLSFTWDVEVGDEFVYNIVFVRTVPEGFSDVSDRPSIQNFNNSQITVTISYLPLVLAVWTGELFLSVVVNPNKISCTLENGTIVIDEAFELISKSILPIGGWNVIVSFFPSNSESYQGIAYDTYFSEIRGEFLFFGYRKLIGDDTSFSWSSYIDMNTGIPVNVTQRFFDLTYIDDTFFTLMQL